MLVPLLWTGTFQHLQHRNNTQSDGIRHIPSFLNAGIPFRNKDINWCILFFTLHTEEPSKSKADDIELQLQEFHFGLIIDSGHMWHKVKIIEVEQILQVVYGCVNKMWVESCYELYSSRFDLGNRPPAYTQQSIFLHLGIRIRCEIYTWL